jgi:hypothetical protein
VAAAWPTTPGVPVAIGGTVDGRSIVGADGGFGFGVGGGAGAGAGLEVTDGRLGFRVAGGSGAGAGVSARGSGATGGTWTVGLGPGRVAAGAVARMAGISEGLGLRLGEGSAGGAATGVAGAMVVGFVIKCLIRSTIDGSKLARALTLTSSPQRWIRSSNSWLLRPSSFANSWTRVDNGNSSWLGRIGPVDRSQGLCRPTTTRPECRDHSGGGMGAVRAQW